jgi:hypothetical protein
MPHAPTQPCAINKLRSIPCTLRLPVRSGAPLHGKSVDDLWISCGRCDTERLLGVQRPLNTGAETTCARTFAWRFACELRGSA